MSKRNRRWVIYLVSGVFSLAFGSAALAQHGHGSGSGGTDKASHGSGGGSHSVSMMNRPVQSKTVEGYKISLDIMDMSMHTSIQTKKGNPVGDSDKAKTHAIMVNIEDTASKEIITDAKVKYTIVSPSGTKETGKLDWSGDHFGRGFSPKEKGDFQVEVAIESGGMEREAKFSYKL